MRNLKELLEEYRIRKFSAFEESMDIVSSKFQNEDYLGKENKEKRVNAMKEYLFFRALQVEGFKLPKKGEKDTPIERLYNQLNTKNSQLDKIATHLCMNPSSFARVDELNSKFIKNAVYTSIKKDVSVNQDALQEFMMYAGQEKGLEKLQRKRLQQGATFPTLNTSKDPIFSAKEIDEYQKENLSVIKKGVAAKQFTDSIEGVQKDLSNIIRYLKEDNQKRQAEAKNDPKKAPVKTYNELIEAIQYFQKNISSDNPSVAHDAMKTLKEAAQAYKDDHNAIFRLSKGRERRNAASSIIDIVGKHIENMEVSFKAISNKSIEDAESPSTYDIYNNYTEPYERYKGKLDCMRMVNATSAKMMTEYQTKLTEKGANERIPTASILATHITNEQMKQKVSAMKQEDAYKMKDEIKNAYSGDPFKLRVSIINKTGHFNNYLNIPDKEIKQKSFDCIKELVHCKENKLPTKHIPAYQNIAKMYIDPNDIKIENDRKEYIQKLRQEEELENQKLINKQKKLEEAKKLKEQQKKLKEEQKKLKEQKNNSKKKEKLEKSETKAERKLHQELYRAEKKLIKPFDMQHLRELERLNDQKGKQKFIEKLHQHNYYLEEELEAMNKQKKSSEKNKDNAPKNENNSKTTTTTKIKTKVRGR